jgi:predicted DCC family thiol-disulfide oxidoreductase YuxK
VNTEITDRMTGRVAPGLSPARAELQSPMEAPLQGQIKGPMNGWVLYDASCSLCTGLMARVQSMLEAGGFRAEPLQSTWVRANLNMPEDVLLAEMRVLTLDGRLMGGADALVYLSRKLKARIRPWWAWVLVAVSRIPFAMPVLRFVYARVAERRYCRRGGCPVARPHAARKGGIQ